MEKRVKKENNSDHLKQLPLIFFCISFWFFFYSMHWLYFYDIVMYWSFQILKNCNEPLTPLSISPYNPFLHTFALLSWLLNHHIFLAIFLSSVGGSWFSTCFSQCWHYLRISLRLFFFFLTPDPFHRVAHLRSWIPLPQIYVSRGLTCPSLPWASTAVAHPGGLKDTRQGPKAWLAETGSSSLPGFMCVL